jgi:soluble lytic murein transglycosylase-like protein
MIEALIITIALDVGVSQYLVLSIAYTENPTLDPLAINKNINGTLDRGIMQLNSSWYKNENWMDPEENIRAGCEHIKWLLSLPNMNFWTVAVSYNCGYSRFIQGPPEKSLDYADQVFMRLNQYTKYRW